MNIKKVYKFQNEILGRISRESRHIVQWKLHLTSEILLPYLHHSPRARCVQRLRRKMTGENTITRGRVPSFYTTRSREGLDKLETSTTQSDHAKELLENKNKLLAGKTPLIFAFPVSLQRVALMLVAEHFSGNLKLREILRNQKLRLSHLMKILKQLPLNCLALLMRMTSMKFLKP